MIHPILKTIAVAWLLTLSSCVERTAQTETKPKRPNVIVIVTDDQGYGDLSYHGNPIIKTPHLDAFARQSLEVTNFHVGTTCAPTRAGLMTGRNANRNNTWHTIAGCSILLEDEETMPEVFLRNGYRTAMLGKWHLGDNFPFRPHDRGFQNAFYHGGGGIQQTPDYWNNDYFDDTYFRNGIPEKTTGYCTDVWFEEAITYTQKQQTEPFFLYLALNAAHGPFNVPKAYMDRYASAPLTERQKRFYGMISNIDDNFGRLIEHLKRTGQFDNTILVFTTDNGTAVGLSKTSEGEQVLGYNADLRGTKGSHYDGGHKVPFFISWPDGAIPRKAKTDQLMAHVDLLPTLAAVTGLDYSPKKPLDGQNMGALLRGEKVDPERMLVVDTQRNQLPEKGRNPCVMQGPWRLVNGDELYNTEKDPGQQNNIALDHPERVAALSTFYDQWWSGIQADIRYAEIPLGHAESNPVLLTIHDMHTEDDLPWNQVQIRKGEAHPVGYYSIRVVEAGDYQFKLYRYAPESKRAIQATPKAISATPSIDGLPEGKGLIIERAQVEVGGKTFTSSSSESNAYIAIRAQLEAGSQRLRGMYVSSNGEHFAPYYMEIEKL